MPDSHRASRDEYVLPYQWILAGLAALIVVQLVILWSIQGGSSGPPSPKPQQANPAQRANPVQTEQVNVNIASREELLSVSGIGEKTADRILELRKSKPFADVAELRDVPGVTALNFDRMKDEICTD